MMRPVQVASVGFTSLLGALLGYDIGIISGAIIFIRDDLGLSTRQAEVVVGSLNLVSALGALVVGSLADRLGRKGAIALAQLLFVAGTLTMVLSSAFAGLLVGRILMGLGVGCGFVVGPLYAAELSPPALRGMFTALFEVAIGLGILLGYAVAYVCRDMPLDTGWRVMVGCGGVPPLVSLLLLALLPESPRFLWASGRRQQAREVLMRVADPAEVDACCDEIEASCLATPDWRAALAELVCPRSRAVRAMVVVGLGLTVSQQANGSEAVVYYMPTILASAGVRGREALLGGTMLVGIFRTVFILVGAMLVDRWGRRPLLLTSSAGIAVSLFALAASLGLGAAAIPLTVVGLCLFMGSYAFGIGPLNMVVVSEVFPFRLRAVAMSLAIFLNRLVSGTVASTFLSLTEAISMRGTFLLFGGIATLSWLFVLYMVPETKGKSLEEMETFFEQLEDERRLRAREKSPLVQAEDKPS